MGQGLATWKGGRGGGDVGVAIREVGLPLQQKWALETSGPGFKPSSSRFAVSLDPGIPTSELRFSHC